ncbi:MAG: DEAD/DEAH box helicase [Nostoc sp. NOS(2021)]|uniref:DEAD/DEAH box helicase n=1 Tax=Nostoc sp. NOS(2021) TaxID=2815407 RepID=UPI0025DAFBF2|nr:type ISP restriction/modification enzyme [Nostoc sp. NOS(2021)]MBN3893801.1 DEAD/DEAH box helicase [Nostoc sp. NOS(2021)]
MTTTTISTILEEFRQNAISNRDLGDKFERLMVTYLKTDPLYKDLYSNVWMWMDFPKRGNAPDTGIDLVSEERATGDYCAIQCKFYDPNHTLDKSDIDSFFTASGKALFKKRMIVSTTDRWGKNAEDAIKNQHIPVTRLRVQDLAESPVDWSQFSLKRPQDIKLKNKKEIRPHQSIAIEKVIAGFKDADQGKLIMACGTGKTFTALKISELFTTGNVAGKAQILFLVPSISLLSQTLREWTAEAKVTLHSIVVCSDTKVSKKSDVEDISTRDLIFPATTDAQTIASRVQAFEGNRELTVIFSTYQSIQAIADAQAKGLPEFDLIICDEAHRTTGVTLQGDEESYFVRVHDQKFLKGKKRLYMTATPKLYSDGTKTQAQENDATLCSMDDVNIYGTEFHRLGFSEAVSSGLLTDYKVMVLAVDEKYVSIAFQKQIADADNELQLEDAVKITGCWNGLSKRLGTDADGEDIKGDIAPMRRAVAFSRTIKESQKIENLFSNIVEEYHGTHPDEDILHCEVKHVDGTQNSLQRNQKLDWLKEDTSGSGNTCRILSNARCLSEGVDVPSLDAVIFLTPRNSVVDVVQSVGRVMRKSEGKKYGYIILPIGIPADLTPEEALKDNNKYKVVWQVLQALRAHDDRFNATINQIDLNKSRPPQINVIGVGGSGGDNDGTGGSVTASPVQMTLNFPHLEEWRDAIYAKIVVKCGERRYWESWAKDVATIAERHFTRIKALLESPELQHRQAFNEFLHGLQSNLNPSVSEDDAIEMLSQHLITKPVFDALFEDYQFTQHNPVSLAMQKMLDLLEEQSLEEETKSLEKFYSSVRRKASGIDNAEGKQKIVIELYDKFFRTAFPRMAERLGIVYTPVELVDFIIKSVDDALKQEFGVGLTDRNVHILDPFTGTGSFIVRLLQSGLIEPKDLIRKFQHELHANEIILLAYYIAAINIEGSYHGLAGREYETFKGMVLTDTFQMFEHGGTMQNPTISNWQEMFPENNQRVVNQKKRDIRVIIGNPPYSAGQKSENDSNKNLKYPQLDERIRETYAKHSTATNKNGLYSSEIRAIRWASDRIKDKGIVCYVINGAFIDSNSADGLRKCLNDEFTSIYCFNLRGNQRTSGETSRIEGGKIFGSGSRASIAITLLIKNPEKTGGCQLFYHDIGDYLSREEKLHIIKDFKGITGIQWETVTPNSSYDWINQRDPGFDEFMSLGDKQDATTKTIFDLYSPGVQTNRDAWAYNFSRNSLKSNINKMIENYTAQVFAYNEASQKTKDNKKLNIENFIENNSKLIKWSSSLKQNLERKRGIKFRAEGIVISFYRPFCKQNLYFDRDLNHRVYQMPKFFAKENLKNLVICVTGIGASKEFSALITDVIPNLHLHDTSQCFPLYTYEKQEDTGTLFTTSEYEYTKKENIPESILTDFRKTYSDKTITKEDIFYYVYGILHSPEYKRRFEADLKKMLLRIPYTQDFWAFSKAGCELAPWHLNYETIEPYPLMEDNSGLLFLDNEDYRVEKMSFGRRAKVIDKTTIIYNSKITLSGIPLETYDYVVNGKSALEWIMDRYQFTKDKDSQITNDPNDWSEDPRYILDLVKRIVRVSLESMKIVNALPALNEHK